MTTSYIIGGGIVLVLLLVALYRLIGDL